MIFFCQSIVISIHGFKKSDVMFYNINQKHGNILNLNFNVFAIMIE